MDQRVIVINDDERRSIRGIFCVALLATGICFTLRYSTLPQIQQDFLTDGKLLPKELSLFLPPVALIGFTLSVLVGTLLLHKLSAKRMLLLSSVSLVLGLLLSIAMPLLARTNDARITLLTLSALLLGVGGGLTAAVVNPLLCSIFSAQRTWQINAIYAWPAGGVIVALALGYGCNRIGLNWQVQLCAAVLAALSVGGLALRLALPALHSNTLSEGVRKECRQPFFLAAALCMLLIPVVAFSAEGLLRVAISRTVDIQPAAVLLYVAVLTCSIRHIAGRLEELLGGIGLLWSASLLTFAGLLLLSFSHSSSATLAAVTLWVLGLACLWPTLLSIVCERLPGVGVFGVGLLTTLAGLGAFLSAHLVPSMFESAKLSVVNSESALRSVLLTSEVHLALLYKAAQSCLSYLALAPLVLMIIFGLQWLLDRRVVQTQSVGSVPVPSDKPALHKRAEEPAHKG